MSVHHTGPWVSPTALAAHGAAAVALTLILGRAERILTAALGLVRRVRRLLAPRPVGARPLMALFAEACLALPAGRMSAPSCRGPPSSP